MQKSIWTFGLFLFGLILAPIAGGGHVPALSASFNPLVLDFLLGADGSTIFDDGFESGDLSAWSLVVP